MKNSFFKKYEYKLYAFGTVFLWASAFVFTKVGLQYFTASALGLFRYISASLALLVIGYIKKIGFPETRDIPKFLFSGAVGFTLYMITFNKGSQSLTSATGSVIIAIAPILTAAFSSFIFKEKINFKGWLSIMVSFVGILVLALWNGVFSIDIGIILMLSAAILLAVYNITQREYVKKYTAFQSTSYSIFAGTVLLMIFLPESIPQLISAEPKAWLVLIYLGVFPSAIAYIWWSKALSVAEVTSEVTNFMFVTPLISAVMGSLIINEMPSLETYIGGGIILSGLILFNKYR